MIKINHVSKYYRQNLALENVFLEIPDRQVVGLLGENGTGKTTLLKSIAGLIDFNRGEVIFDDIKTQKDKNRKIAFITEEGSFFPFMTPRQNANFYSDFYDNFDRGRFEKLIDFFNLPPNKKARTFSKGQKAKLEVALGFSKGAKYILLDEPFLGSDIFTRRDFLRLMCDSLIDDETIIIATHLIDEIENFIDRAVFLKDGRIKDDIIIDEIKAAGGTLEEAMKRIFEYDEDRFRRIFKGDI